MSGPGPGQDKTDNYEHDTGDSEEIETSTLDTTTLLAGEDERRSGPVTSDEWALIWKICFPVAVAIIAAVVIGLIIYLFTRWRKSRQNGGGRTKNLDHTDSYSQDSAVECVPLKNVCSSVPPSPSRHRGRNRKSKLKDSRKSR